MLSEESIVAILVAVLASGSVSSLTTYLLKSLYEKSHGSPRQKALETGVQALLFEKLGKLHSQMIDRGGWSPDAEKQMADRIYQAYHDLGGNGVGTALHDDILSAHSRPTKTEEYNNMEELETAETGYVPAVPDWLRTAIYYIGLIVAAVSFVILAMAGEMDWPRWVETLSGAIGTAFGGIASGLGVAYRPSRFTLTKK